jgi:RNA methyltransferase, TrmH family
MGFHSCTSLNVPAILEGKRHSMSERAPSTAERRLIAALRRRKERERNGLFLAEGVRVVEELLASPIVPRLAVVSSTLGDSPRGAALRDALAARCPVRTVPEHELAQLADTDTPQGVVVAAAIPRAAPAAGALPARCTVLLLDAVQDPGNFGTLVRSAVAFAAPLVIALPGTVDPWNGKAVRSAAGASFRVPILQQATTDAAGWLREHGFVLYVADAGGTPVDELPPAPRVALAVGNEGAGVGAALLSLADARVAVPMPGPAESLNVAVAAGILLYALAQRT